MTQPGREETIFATLLGLPADQRGVYLAGACEGDEDLRRRLEELLAAHESDTNFMASPAAEDLRDRASTAVRLSEKPGDRIGRYKLMEQIGEGGCGVVYVAEQAEPVRRRVAVKIIKLATGKGFITSPSPGSPRGIMRARPDPTTQRSIPQSEPLIRRTRIDSPWTGKTLARTRSPWWMTAENIRSKQKVRDRSINSHGPNCPHHPRWGYTPYAIALSHHSAHCAFGVTEAV